MTQTRRARDARAVVIRNSRVETHETRNKGT
jgi:hypothetical protein